MRAFKAFVSKTLDHLRYDNGKSRALPRLQNASGPDPPAFQRLGAQVALGHPLSCPLRNDDREVFCPVSPEIEIGSLRAFAHASDAPLDEDESADPVSQAVAQRDIDGLIAVIGP
jgi:hypothetical protein